MAVKNLKKLNSKTPELNRVQDNFEAALQPIINCPIINGILLKNIELKTGSTNEIDHTLGRALRGWLVVRKRSQADIWDLQDSNTLKTKTLSLACSSNVIIDLWIF